jgi:hypothetical protein
MPAIPAGGRKWGIMGHVGAELGRLITFSSVWLSGQYVMSSSQQDIVIAG